MHRRRAANGASNAFITGCRTATWPTEIAVGGPHFAECLQLAPWSTCSLPPLPRSRLALTLRLRVSLPPGPLDAFLNPLSDLGEKGVCDTPIQPEPLESPRLPNSDSYDGLRCRRQRPTTPQHRLTSGHEPSTSAMSRLIGAVPWPCVSRESLVWQHFRCSLLFVVSRRFSVACGVFGGFAFECSTPHRQNPTGRRSGSRPGT